MSRWTSRNPYEVLGLPDDASLADVKSAYRSLAKRLHPDANHQDPRAAAAFHAVNKAYEKICDDCGAGRQRGPLLRIANDEDVSFIDVELRDLGAGVESQVASTARLRPYNRQLPMLAAAATELRLGGIASLDPNTVELFRRSAFTDDEHGIRLLISNAVAAMRSDRALFAHLRHAGMGADALTLLAEAIVCEAAVQQHEGEMILDGQFFSAVVQSRLALLVRRTEMVVRQLMAHDCMKPSESSGARTTDSATATTTSDGFVVLE